VQSGEETRRGAADVEKILRPPRVGPSSFEDWTAALSARRPVSALIEGRDLDLAGMPPIVRTGWQKGSFWNQFGARGHRGYRLTDGDRIRSGYQSQTLELVHSTPNEPDCTTTGYPTTSNIVRGLLRTASASMKS